MTENDLISSIQMKSIHGDTFHNHSYVHEFIKKYVYRLGTLNLAYDDCLDQKGEIKKRDNFAFDRDILDSDCILSLLFT